MMKISRLPFQVMSAMNVGNLLQKGACIRSFTMGLRGPIKSIYPEGDSWNYRQKNKLLVRGFDPMTETFAPKTSFSSLFWDPKIQSVINARGFKEPTVMQAQSWPPIFEGRDTIIVSKTGTGKTFGTLAALYQKLLTTEPLGPVPSDKLQSPRLLILSPRRELVHAIADEAAHFTSACGIKAVSVCGGYVKENLLKTLAEQKGADVMIATPPRLNTLIKDGLIDLSRVQYVVLDEGHVLLNIKMRTGTKTVLKQIANKNVQTIACGARWNQISIDTETVILRKRFVFIQKVRDARDMRGEPTARAFKAAAPAKKRRMIARLKLREKIKAQESEKAAAVLSTSS
jgi:superfamily II DNA/RNA helicase